jgi:hypothetical protein
MKQSTFETIRARRSSFFREGPPFRGANYALTREVALFCEGLEPKKR